MSDGRVDWQSLMRLGLGRLRLAPDVFWSMTPRELRAALEGVGLIAGGGQARLGHARLAELMALYPDAGQQDDAPREAN